MPTPHQMIAESSPLWNDCNEISGATILRLSLLRRLMRQLHAEKSRLLANGLKKEAVELKSWELRVNGLKDAPSLEGPLEALIQAPPSEKKKKHHLPEALFQVIERQKLIRYDREWEQAMASEAVKQNWRFWNFQVWVKVESVELWERNFSETLWPYGVILYAENAEQTTSITSVPLNASETTSLWLGSWTILLHPRFTHPSELLTNLKEYSELAKISPTRPLWTHLYPHQ